MTRLWSVFVDLKPLDDTKPETKKAFAMVGHAVAELVDAIDSQSPFYPKGIYVDLDDLRVMAKIELSEAAVETPDEVPDWARRRREKWNELKSRVSAISDKIRERLSHLTVVTGSR